MMASELLNNLTELIKEHGDQEMYICFDGGFCGMADKVFPSGYEEGKPSCFMVADRSV